MLGSKKKSTKKAKTVKKSSGGKKSSQAEAKALLAKMKAKTESGDCAFC